MENKSMKNMSAEDTPNMSAKDTSNMSAKDTSNRPTKTSQVYQLAIIGVMTAVISILGPLAIPIGIVPISLTNLAIFFSLYTLGMKKGTVSYLVYLFLGFAGIPVFSGFTAGPSKLFGPTGGYLIGFIFMALIAGLFIDKFIESRFLCVIGMILGTIVCYGFGTAWLAYQAGMPLGAALAAGVVPFIPGDLAKVLVSAIIGPQIRKRLISAGLFM